MRVTVSAAEPLILRDAQFGDVFLLHIPSFADCVFALLTYNRSSDRLNDTYAAVVCVGCRLGPGDVDYVPVGTGMRVNLDSPISLLDQVEPLALLERPRATSDSECGTASYTGSQAQPEPISRL